MPPVIAAIVLIGTQIATAVASVVSAVGAILAGHITLAALITVGKAILFVASIVSAVSSLGKSKKTAASTQGQELALKLDPTMTRQVAVGQTATGGSQVYAFTYTDDTNIPNKYLVRVVDISDWLISGITSVMDGTTSLTFSGDPTAGWVTCNQFKNKAGTPCMWIRIYKGSFSPTADSNLVSWEPNGLWTSNHKGVGVAYVVTRFTFDPNGDAFPSGEPNLYYTLQGAPLYDQRLDSTRINPSRSGSQRLNTPSTYAYSENASVIVQQLLRGFSTNGVLIVGAGADDNDLADSMLLSAYNICDTATTTKSGGSEALFRAGIMLDASRSTSDLLTDLTLAMSGTVSDRGGAITIIPDAAYSPVTTITSEDIMWGEEKSYQPQASLSDLYNYVIGSYPSSVQFFQSTPYPIQGSGSYQTADGERLAMQQDFNAIFSDSQIQRVTGQLLASSRDQAVAAFVGPLWLSQIEQGDWFQLTVPKWNQSAGYFKCVEATLSADLKYAIVAKAVSPGARTWNAAIQEIIPTLGDASSSVPIAIQPGGVRQSYIQDQDPTTYQYINGTLTAGTFTVSDGAMWYQPSTGTFYQRANGSWTSASTPASSIIPTGTLIYSNDGGPYTHTVPSNAQPFIRIKVWGGGGGGRGGVEGYSNFGGNSGAYSEHHIAVTPGSTVIAGAVGGGGDAAFVDYDPFSGSFSVPPTAGTDSTVTTGATITAHGGGVVGATASTASGGNVANTSGNVGSSTLGKGAPNGGADAGDSTSGSKPGGGGGPGITVASGSGYNGRIEIYTEST